MGGGGSTELRELRRMVEDLLMRVAELERYVGLDRESDKSPTRGDATVLDAASGSGKSRKQKGA